MGEAAPAWGSTPALNTVSGFLVGKWTPRLVDPVMAKQLGLATDKEEAITDIYNFSADGNLTIDRKPWKVGGKWTAVGNTVSIVYTELNGKPMADEIARITKAAEVGTQAGVRDGVFLDWVQNSLQKETELAVHADQKMLAFGGSDPSAGVMAPLLERLDEVRE